MKTDSNIIYQKDKPNKRSKLHNSNTGPKVKKSVNKENPRFYLHEIKHDLSTDIIEYIDYSKQQSHSRNSGSNHESGKLVTTQQQQAYTQPYNLSRSTSVPLINVKEKIRSQQQKTSISSMGDHQQKNESEQRSSELSSQSISRNLNGICLTQESFEPVPRRLSINMCQQPQLTIDKSYQNQVEDATLSGKEFTERTDITESIDYQSNNGLEDDQYQVFNSSDILSQIYKQAQFYQARNYERIDNKDLHLFPYSTEYDIEEDPSLPQVIPPFLPAKSEGCKEYTLVLDLDETLIHFEDSNESTDVDGEVFYMVRPGVNRFLTELSNYYELVVFTAAVQDYADWILNQVDQKKQIAHRLYRQHTKRKQNYAIKDLSLLGRDLRKTIIIDNIAENFLYTQPFNGMQIVSWYDDLDDDELDKLLPFLKQIVVRQERDVREVIKLYGNNPSDYLKPKC